MKNYIGFLIVLVAYHLQTVQAQEKLIDRVVATVGSGIILQSDVENEYTQYLARGAKPDNSVKCHILNELVMTKLLAQQAVLDSIDVSESEVDDQINSNMNFMIRQAGNIERLEGFLKRSILQYKEEIRPSMAEKMRADQLRRNILQKVTITPQEVKKYFESLDQDSLPYFNTEVEIGEIVIEPELTREEKEQFRKRAEGYRQQVLNGTEFGTVARFYSECPSSVNGGNLNFGTRESYVKEFSAVAFKLKPGEISPVFETSHGFHFLQVLERRGEEVNVRHVLITTKATPASLERAKAKIDSIYEIVAAGKMGFHTAASMYSDDEMSKFNGGMVFDQHSQTRSTVISVEALERDVFSAIDTLEPGQYSKPYQFVQVEEGQSAGKPAFKFNYLRTRIPPHQANLDQDYAKIQQVAQQEKTYRYLSEWFEKKTATTYIHIDEEFGSCEDLKIWFNKDSGEVIASSSTEDN